MITDEMVERVAILGWNTARALMPEIDAWSEAFEERRESQRAEARAVLAYAATLGPTREARLVQYRCAALGGLMARDLDEPTSAAIAERMAHAMLAAERLADAE